MTGTAAGALMNTTNATMTTTTTTTASTSVVAGYELYQKSLLEVPWPHAEYGEASSDDLSSEWDSDVPEPQLNSKVNNYYGLFMNRYCVDRKTHCMYQCTIVMLCVCVCVCVCICQILSNVGFSAL
jgi:hypothetical protein